MSNNDEVEFYAFFDTLGIGDGPSLDVIEADAAALIDARPFDSYDFDPEAADTALARMGWKREGEWSLGDVGYSAYVVASA